MKVNLPVATDMDMGLHVGLSMGLDTAMGTGTDMGTAEESVSYLDMAGDSGTETLKAAAMVRGTR